MKLCLPCRSSSATAAQIPVSRSGSAGPSGRGWSPVPARGTGATPTCARSPWRPQAPRGAHRRVAERILAYEVFPPRWITGVLRRRPVEVGDTVGIRFHFAPGIDLFFAARVVSVLDGEAGGTWSTGFTYRTLVGHPELGEETFSVEKDLASGRVSAALRSWSRPGTLLAKAFAPLVRVFQVRASRAALDHLSTLARG
ncbi:MAG TPA: DUF1990 family protein [Planctomycetota bacterium]|nr:DUF1990 family protein [Planctomycetota bacterium]